MVHTIRQVCPKTLSSARIASNITHVILTRVGLRLRLVIRVATLCVVWFDSILHCWGCIIRLLSFLLNNDTCHNLVAHCQLPHRIHPHPKAISTARFTIISKVCENRSGGDRGELLLCLQRGKGFKTAWRDLTL